MTRPVRPLPPYEAAHPWIGHLMRLGFAARGILYALIGLLTLASIFNHRHRMQVGMSDAFISISSVTIYYLRPGIVLLLGLAVGFAGFALGMMWTAFFDWNDEGRSLVGILKRLGTFIGGAGHIGLMATAVLMMIGHQPNDDSTRRWTAWALDYPGGRILVAIAGTWAGGYGLFLLSKFVTGRLDNKLDYTAMSKSTTRWTNITGRFGMLSRGAIYLTIGCVLVVAGWMGTARNVVGFGGAMLTIAQDTFGWIALSAIAIGLFAYGIFMMIEARYRRIGRRT
ncbi:MAG: DUF1206 domain-containing protein [Phycisphaerae bacterium]|nr:DUF1206 domain-containing protein [Phycisphaerae bacterium]